MNRRFSIIYCAAFFVACIFFAAGAAFSPGDTEAEGRDLAKFPAFTKDGDLNTAFFTEFDAWLSDRITGRQSLITLNSALREKVFATGSDQVIVGEDGFLFYRETVADYTRENLLSADEVEQIASALKELSDYANQKGAAFLVAVAPNKNTVYPDRMPSAYRKIRENSAESSNLDLLHEALEAQNIPYVDLRQCFTESEQIWYHKRDTHWNGAGALAAYNAILNAASVPHQTYEKYPLMKSTDFPGDLDGMMYPGAGKTDENFIPDFDFSSAFVYTSAYTSPMDMTITTRSGGEGSLLVFRDSFGSALIPYFSASFRDVRYERAMPYRIDILDRYKADLVIVEIAERNIPLLASAADRIGTQS